MPDGIWSQMFSTGPVVFLERLRCFSSQIAFEYSVRNHGFSRIRAPWAPAPYYCSTGYTYLNPGTPRRRAEILACAVGY